MPLLCCGKKAASAVRPEQTGRATAVREEYNMWVMPMSTFVELGKLQPHQLLKESGKIVQFDASMRTVFFLSHQCVVCLSGTPDKRRGVLSLEKLTHARSPRTLVNRWTGFQHPDQTLEQLHTMQRLFLRMMAGNINATEPDFGSRAYLPNMKKVTAREWAELVPTAYIWMDYFSVPQIGEYLQGDTSDLIRAVNSIPSYIERSSHFFACVPMVKHNDREGVMCDLGSWLSRGWCRVEMFSLLFKRFNELPVIVVKGGECQPYMISAVNTMARPPGKGEFTCCMRGHKMTNPDGTERGIPCDKLKIGELTWTMLQRKLSFLLGDDRIQEYRLWLALVPLFMEGLPENDAALQASRSSKSGACVAEAAVKDFLATYRFKTPKDEEGGGSGLTPLVHAAAVGNVEVAAGLIAQGADVHCTTQKFNITTGLDAGGTALHIAVGFCPVRQVEMVEVLLRSGADANAQTKAGYTPLMAGAGFQNTHGVKALLGCAKETLDIERGMKMNRSTALGLAAYVSSPEICDIIMKAGASRTLINDHGGTNLHDACQNVATTKAMLNHLWNEGELDINALYKPRTMFWRLADAYFRRGVKLGLLTKSQFAMEMAHTEGSTPLHYAAMVGLIDVTEWLLGHGAHKSLRVQNSMGATPLDIARIFGPFPAIEAKLGAAMLNHDFDTQFAIRRGSLLRRHASGAVVEPEAGDTPERLEESRPAGPTASQPEARPTEHTTPVETIQVGECARTSGEDTTMGVAGAHTVPTTADRIMQPHLDSTLDFERSSAVDVGSVITMLSSRVDARFDEQAAEQAARFDEQAARLDAANARFDAVQADNSQLQAQLRAQNAKLDALLSAALTTR